MMINYVKQIVKSDFKQQSYGLDTILLLGLAVTVTFKVAALMLHSTRRLNMVIIHVKKTSNNKVMGHKQFCWKGHAVTLTFKVATQMLRATHCVNRVINYVK